MKHLLYTLTLILIITSFTTPQEKTLDPALYGTWQGTEKDQIMLGMESFWIQERFEDGTFMLLYTYTIEENGKPVVKHGSEKGRWWVKDGVFYEYHNVSGNTDIYTYEVLDSERVKFDSKKMSFPTAAKVYSFIDYRVPDA